MQILAASIRYDKANPVASIAVCPLKAITGAGGDVLFARVGVYLVFTKGRTLI